MAKNHAILHDSTHACNFPSSSEVYMRHRIYLLFVKSQNIDPKWTSIVLKNGNSLMAKTLLQFDVSYKLSCIKLMR